MKGEILLGAADVPSKIVRGEGNKDEANKESVARSDYNSSKDR